MKQVLLVDDEAATLYPPLSQHLEPKGFTVLPEADPQQAVARIKDANPDLVLLDLHFPGDDRMAERTTGGELLKAVRQQHPETPVLVFTTRLEQLDIPLERFESPPHGQYAKPDFAGDSQWAENLAAAMSRAIDAEALSRNPDKADLGFLVGQTEAMRQAVGVIGVAAQNTLSVTIYGEQGTGKALVAKAIHKKSGRTGPFVEVNCRTLDGDEALRRKIKEAAGGTLYFEEIQYIDPRVQDYLSDFTGSGRSGVDSCTDIRLIVGTSHSLNALVDDEVLQGTLAEDLATLLIALPALRDRLEDMPLLFRGFVDQACEDQKVRIAGHLRPETAAKLDSYNWPNNLSELRSRVFAAVAVTAASGSNVILPDHIQLPCMHPPPGLRKGTEMSSVAERVDAFEEITDKSERYLFLKDIRDIDVRADVLIEISSRLRHKLGRNVTHIDLAAEIHPLRNYENDIDAVRQFVNTALRRRGTSLTRLEFNH